MIKVNAAISILVGTVAAWIASTMATDTDSLGYRLEQINANAGNRPAPTVNDAWYATNPVLFGLVVAVCVFVIGLLVIMASNSERS